MVKGKDEGEGQQPSTIRSGVPSAWACVSVQNQRGNRTSMHRPYFIELVMAQDDP